jgi:hypothetical protein
VIALRRRTLHPLLYVAGALGCVLLYFRDPASGAPFPACPIHALTGLDCPICGSGRALHRLLHGRIHEAFSLNPLLVIALPLSVLAWRFRASLPRFTPWVVLGVVVAFTILRNLPWGPVAWMSSFH